ncbi:major facilitator transporter [Burkholderia multivorans]|uniref:MFS transporter n=1 Tax=Burkholderia multivorans TaxID=87883 RepID=UPI0019BDE468|nr:MFS transporter [Burkholderia multivorans]MBU9669188.1 MFS transporter [Burkholderia multivorans]CAB5300946.1 major facilitator transporter [Burkholderia multivorans]CAB5305581.1 major facilitator transporter [Burkholderia multivorans]CAB5310453.1 major facilitator transporter [Burkholderia multivorans]CAB5312479.1 major facilitator transporter [Burkholderia multivorans]
MHEKPESTLWQTSPIDRQTERQIFRKVSMRILPVLILCFFINYVDRANLGVLFSPLSKDLGLSASSFGLAAGLFYVGYLLFEVPSNMAMVRFGARVWIARIMVSWGIVTVLLAASHGATALYVLRFMLGVAEAGFFPGVIFYLTLWYPRNLLGQSYLILELSVPFSLALGSAVTSSLLLLDGIAGIPGWRWVFMLEGLPAVLVGLLIFFTLPDSPATAKWLSADERAYLLRAAAPPPANGKEDLRGFRHIISKPLAWLFAVLLFSMVIGFWAVTYFLPKIMQERFHVGAVQAGFMAAIPWAVAAIVIVVVAWTSAKTGDRKWHLLVCLILSAAGLFVTAITGSPIVALIGLCVGAAGVQASVPLFWTMPSTSFAGANAAIAIALVNCIGNTSGLIGPWLLGFSNDLTGNSRAGLFVMAGFCLFAGVLAFYLSKATSQTETVSHPDSYSIKHAG